MVSHCVSLGSRWLEEGSHGQGYNTLKVCWRARFCNSGKSDILHGMETGKLLRGLVLSNKVIESDRSRIVSAPCVGHKSHHSNQWENISSVEIRLTRIA